MQDRCSQSKKGKNAIYHDLFRYCIENTLSPKILCLKSVFSFEFYNNFREMRRKNIFYFSKLLKRVTTVNLGPFLNYEASLKDCEAVRKAFHEFSCVIIQDPRVTEEKNETFLDLLEMYFSKRQAQLDQGLKVDVYPETQYEIGLTPPYILKLMDHSDLIHKFTHQNKILTPFPSQPLSKMRYLWNIGTVTPDIPSNKIPEDFPEFQAVFNDWGKCMFDAVNTTVEMLAVGLGLPANTFKEKLVGGASKLAPNANDLRRCKKGEPFSGIHYDFSLMSIHGKCRYPGLFIWLPNGEKIKISIPRGYLLLQAGNELEYLTGGYIKCGYHEAVNTPEVEQQTNRVISQGKQPWRITSTMFSHLRSDVLLEPLNMFASSQAKAKYPPIKQSVYMMEELAKVKAKGGNQ